MPDALPKQRWVKTAGDQIQIGRFNTISHWLLQTNVKGLKLSDRSTYRHESPSRLHPEVGRMLDIVGIGARIGGSALTTSEQLKDPGTAIAGFPWLGKQPPNWPSTKPLIDESAIRIYAGPKARQSAEECMDPRG